MSRSAHVTIIAGEVSGDIHAARLVAAVRRRNPAVQFSGIGGEHMRAAGVATRHDARTMAVTGITEAVRRYPALRGVFFDVLGEVRASRPDLLILVDYPGFNLRLAARAHALGIRVLYYICPQVWAWNRARIPRMARSVDRLLTFFPFEPAYFEGTSLQADFVGHPLVDEARATLAEPAPDLPWGGDPRIAILPGSRDHEVERILPVLWDAAARVQARYPGAGFLIPTPDVQTEALVRRCIAEQPAGPRNVDVVVGQTRHVLRQARAAWVASGTATLEAALMECPMVITYRASLLTYLIARLVVRVNHLGIVNIVAGREVCPELLQHRAAPQPLAEALVPLLEEGTPRATMLRDLAAVSAALGGGGAVDRAADIVLEELTSNES